MSDDIRHHYETLPDGRTLSFFLNATTGLVVVDAVEKDERYGNEFVRVHIPPPLATRTKRKLDAAPAVVRKDGSHRRNVRG